MYDRLDALIEQASIEKPKGSLNSLFSSLTSEEKENMYKLLITVKNGRYPHLRLYGAMKKMDREYSIGLDVPDSSSVVPTHPTLFSIQKKESDNNMATNNSMISTSQLDDFIENGYLKLPNLIPKTRVDACLFTLNHELGTPGAMCPGGAQEGLGKLQGGTARHAQIKALASGAALHVIERILGTPAEVSGAQLALRFPSIEHADERAAVNDGRGVWHTDGLRQGKVLDKQSRDCST